MNYTVKEFIGKLQRLPNKIYPPLRAAIAEGALTLIQDEFNSQSGPYGSPWKPLKKKREGNGILDRTGDMRRSAFAIVTSRGIRFGFWKDYWVFHQYGTRKMFKRQLLPDSRGLPRKWREMAKSVFGRVMREELGR